MNLGHRDIAVTILTVRVHIFPSTVVLLVLWRRFDPSCL